MKLPRCIREIIGAFLAFGEVRKRKKAQEQRRQLVFDWLVNKLVDFVIKGWYASTNQTDPVLKTREGVQQHVRWWPHWRKYDEFFSRNYAFNTSNIQRDICDAFADKFPEEKSRTSYLDPCISYLDLNYVDIWRAVMKKMCKVIF